jgi:hypothetical protein
MIILADIVYFGLKMKLRSVHALAFVVSSVHIIAIALTDLANT